MSIQLKLLEDMKRAMKRREKDRLDLVKKTRAAIKNQEIKRRKELDEEEVMEILGEEIQVRWETIAQYEDLQEHKEIEKLKREIGFLSEYLPRQLEEEELKSLVFETIHELQDTQREDIDTVVGAVMPKVKGRATGQSVKNVVMGFLDP